MIPYRDGLSILDSLEDDTKYVRMTITKGVRALELSFKLLNII